MVEEMWWKKQANANPSTAQVQPQNAKPTAQVEPQPKPKANPTAQVEPQPQPKANPTEQFEPQPNPCDFQVYGPRNLSAPSWRDFINSSWKDPKYKRTVMACFIQAVYLLELDRQENRDESTGLAPKWWKPFGYKPTQILADERDGSIYGALFEYEHWSDRLPLRPQGAPRAVLALRGTLLRRPSMARDLQDDLRYLAWESLEGSVRFAGALQALRSAAARYGSGNVCIAGHSLGAGFALQVGQALAKEGVFVECHVFNPPSVSLATSLRSIGEMAGSVWNRVRSSLPNLTGSSMASAATTAVNPIPIGAVSSEGKGSGRPPSVSHSVASAATTSMRSIAVPNKAVWVPNLYLNNSDYICCYYVTEGDGKGVVASGDGDGEQARARMFVAAKGPRKFLEAHGLQQWGADDMELQVAVQQSKLINRQLRSLYHVNPAVK